MVTRDLLRILRNDLPMDVTLQRLGSAAPCSKRVEGRLRFVCPHCGELLATINPRNNLAHCFNCARNINNIDLLLLTGYEFKAAVALLQQWLHAYRHPPPHPNPPDAAVRRNPSKGAMLLADIFRQDLGNQGPDA